MMMNNKIKVSPTNDIKDLLTMKLHESRQIADALEVVRVPGGWLYIRSPQINEIKIGSPLQQGGFTLIPFQPCMIFVPYDSSGFVPKIWEKSLTEQGE